MNSNITCLEVRRILGAEPRRRDAAILVHCKLCAGCATFMKDMQTLDTRLARALAVDVPEGLEARVVFRTAFRPVHRRVFYPWLAAATVVLAVAVGVGVRHIRLQQASMPLTAAVVQHAMNPLEPEALNPHEPLISSQHLDQVLASIGAHMQGKMGGITYARECPLLGRKGQMVAHIVVRGQDGPVTVLLLPHLRLAAAMPVREHGYHGMILPAGAGSIAVVSDNDTPIMPIAEHFMSMVSWSI